MPAPGPAGPGPGPEPPPRRWLGRARGGPGPLPLPSEGGARAGSSQRCSPALPSSPRPSGGTRPGASCSRCRPPPPRPRAPAPPVPPAAVRPRAGPGTCGLASPRRRRRRRGARAGGDEAPPWHLPDAAARLPVRLPLALLVRGAQRPERNSSFRLDDKSQRESTRQVPQCVTHLEDGNNDSTCLSGDSAEVYQREFLALRDRLHAAEQESLKRSKELNLVLDEIKRAVSEKQALRDVDGNRTWGHLSEDTRLKLWNVTHKHVMHLPTVFHHLPHLLSKESSLQPALHVGQGRTGVSIVMGIPSVRREVHSYLTDTLHSLISELSAQEKEDTVIVVLIAETDTQYTMGVTENIKALFPTEIHSGLLEVISPSPHFYPDFSRLRESFGDPKERVRWRTKQNLDYCFLMMYAQAKGMYYVQLEDDIVAKPNYLSTMKNFALQQPSEEWMILEFSQLGFIAQALLVVSLGKMFKSLDLSLIVEFILMFYRDKPIDWLLDHILWVKVCNPEKDAKHCDRQKANLRIRFKPSLFQHVGTHSSLAGKIQKLKHKKGLRLCLSTLRDCPKNGHPAPAAGFINPTHSFPDLSFRKKDKDFGKHALRKEHMNPPAEVSTSLKTYQHFTLEKAYLREDFFWAFTPIAGDFIRFRFFQPLRLERFFFRSGNIEHPQDKLFNTTVEVLPFDNPQSDKEALQEGRGATLRYPRTPDGYLQIGSFSKGVAEGEVDPAFGPLEAVRLSIQTDSPVWVILSEIFLKKAD
ncbi:alpha-1,3-mannosyl-glycoprotein 4-beta-N-acetylglucosaminyltransferase B isoform X3 [Sarcophilus harrisii]|uniref:alpha-1,3-mannosyl-glycoprotein 4-beta-N-acetylglucosaminyltransferase B isoform X3 n=1 Tax=Sarcophilus harrisii TaxID=9305 RepID=UPI001301A69A|nr:alpha-1,3-mannosyl-glycoprotein 4-beta-N-acetylglucosaminyltransferase B isoform X3 [Sarcophilus harrisii]